MDPTSPIDEHSVVISLSIESPDDISFTERRIVLTENRATLEIGRSSSRPTLGLQSAVNNGLIDSPVMSRHHAEIHADMLNKIVKIRDASSMHGTYLNSAAVGSAKWKAIVPQDELVFGVPVYRHEQTFQPATVKVDKIEFRDAPTTSPNRAFTVPDDCSTDDNDLMDESVDDPPSPVKTPAVIDWEENPWHELIPEPCPRSMPQYDGPIDLTSNQGDAECTHRTLSHSDDDVLSTSDEVDENIEWASESSEDSARLTNESTHQRYSSSGASSGGDCLLSPPSQSWNSISTDSMNEPVGDENSEHSSSDFDDEEEGLFASERGLEASPEERHTTKPIVEDSNVAPIPLGATASRSPSPPLLQLSSLDKVQPAAEWANTVGSRHLNIEPASLPSFDRLRSPSDAVLPLGCSSFDIDNGNIDNGTEDSQHAVDVMATEAPNQHAFTVMLGKKAGETDSSEAREVNKLNVSRLQNISSPSKFGSPSSVSDQPGEEEVRPVEASENAQDETLNHILEHLLAGKSGSNENTTSVQHRDTVEAVRIRHTSMADEAAEWERVSADSDKRDGISTLQWSKPVSRYTMAANPVCHDTYFEPTSAFELQQMKQQWRERFHAFANPASGKGIAVSDAQITNQNPVGKLRDAEKINGVHSGALAKVNRAMATKGIKGKRKLAEISDEVDGSQLAWAIKEGQRNTQRSTPPATVSPLVSPMSPPANAHSPFPSPPTTPEEVVHTGDRPNKRMKKIAERVGYAALGGATVGAMVLTSLIYTAPTFV